MYQNWYQKMVFQQIKWLLSKKGHGVDMSFVALKQKTCTVAMVMGYLRWLITVRVSYLENLKHILDFFLNKLIE